MITFAGIGANLETPAVRAWLERYQSSLAPWREFDASFWAGDPDAFRLPLPPKPEPPPVRLGVLWWPTGASRFATCHLLFDTDRLAKIRTAVGSRNATQELRVWDGTTTAAGAANEVRTQMRVVGERKVFDVSSGADLGLTLVSLADARYDWRLKPLSITATPASWTALIAACASALGVAVTPDAVASGLGQPSALWQSSSRLAPVVLDAALNAVGQRLVYRLDGTVVCQNWDTANTLRAANPLPTRKVSGGSIAADVSLRESPEAVRVVFFRANNVGTPYAKTNALGSLGAAAFGAAQGTLGQTASVYADNVVYDGTNAAACDAAALALTKAWYGWRLGPSDTSLPGVYAPVLTGQDDAAEWDHGLAAAGDYPVRTRVYSGFVNWLPPGGPPGGTTSPPPPPPTGCQNCEWLLNPDLGACLKLEAYDANGMCACIDLTQAPISLIYYSGDAGWVGGMFKSCCGCGIMTFKVDSANLKATLDLAPDNKSCQTGGGYTYSLKFNGCCADGSVMFVGSGPDNCSGDPTNNCNNSFSVKVYCDPNPTAANKCDCPACCNVTCSPVMNVVVGGTWPPYSGRYLLNYSADTPCLWSMDCQTASGSAGVITIKNVGGSPAKWQLDIGGAVYQAGAYTPDSPTGFSCYSGGTFSKVSGNALAPASITVTGLICPPTASNKCNNIDTLTLTVTAATGDCACLVGRSCTLVEDLVTGVWNGGMSGCGGGCGEVFVLKCNGDGTWQLQVGRSTGPEFPGSSTASSAVQAKPLFVTFSGVAFGACCLGTVDLVVSA